MPDSPQLTAALSDRYIIQREIGAGGMAVVYLAHDRKLERDVALKVLRPELGAVLGAERFLTEIKIAARLDHPHILTLIDSGDADGLLYYVLPYVRGETLRERLKREQQLGIDDALAITKQVASALDYAHRQGLVHRDIKPENILLQEGEAMLTDFGIALAVKEAGGNRLTQTGLSLGTPQYMSPEQATGDRGIDARSDVYSLASVTYEMLAGEPPVTGASAQAMIAKLMTERPTRVRTLRDTVPDGVDEAIMKALAKTPADRFASAEEFARALDAGMMHANTTASTSARAGASGASHHRGAWIAATVAVLALLAAGAYAWRSHTGAVGHRAALSTKTQLTITGGIYYPAISPDGKQLAYAMRNCRGADCKYAVVEQDVGGTTTRTILDGATAIYDLRWSPDRRNLIFNGTLNRRPGSYLVSALGGTPRYLTLGVAAFYADGDSLLLGSSNLRDSVYWVRVAGLDGVSRDSIPVRGDGVQLAGLSAIPGTHWILTLIIQPPHGLWQVVGRDGHVADHVLNQCTCGGIGTVDAVWLDRAGDAAGESIVRIAIDPATGRLSTQQDTMVTGVFSNVSVTADGARMVMDQGTTDYQLWAGPVSDVLRGALSPDRRIARASSGLNARISPDGARLLFMRVVPTAGGHTEGRISVRAFAGGDETPIEVPGRIEDVHWMDSTSLALLSGTPDDHTHFSVMDVRTGARRHELELPVAAVRDATPTANGWAWIPIDGDRIMVDEAGKERSLAIPAWFGGIFEVVSDTARGRLFVAGFNRATYDTLGVWSISLATGEATRWGAVFAEAGTIQRLDGGAVLLVAFRTADAISLYRVSGPGQMTPVGEPAVPLFGFSASADLKRAVTVQRNYDADAWMYNVIKR